MTIDQVRPIAGELRYETFYEAIKLAGYIGAKCIVETGTWRGMACDGQSTRLLSIAAKELGADFYSVDINSEHVEQSRTKMVEYGLDNVRHSCCDSILFMSLFKSPIQFLYLDSYDFSETTPEPSQLHQVAEVGAAWGKLINKVVILLDDCNIKGGGKGLLSTRFLVERGYKLHMAKYQNLLINF
jgi:hypothetical protein